MKPPEGSVTPECLPVGTRVERSIFMDDGTWARLGDSCLPGPMRRGVIVSVYCVKSRHFGWWDTVVDVLWDEGSLGRYLPHGVKEIAPCH